DQATRLLELGARRVLLKGGHLDGEQSTDVLVSRDSAPEEFTATRVRTHNTHGTGCTLASSIAALLPQRSHTVEAVRDDKAYLTEALRRATATAAGGGQAPAPHLPAWW